MYYIAAFIPLLTYVFLYLSYFYEPQMLIDIESTIKQEKPKKNFILHEIPENMSVLEKKERFFTLVAPAVLEVHEEWMDRYERISNELENGVYSQEIEDLKERYNALSDEELLAALKPHPPSIVLAQAALESAWATSRFFAEANNIFGVWSTNKNQLRIAASEQRDGERTIWLRKFYTIEDSIREYYEMMARARAYNEFRLTRLYSDDVFEIITKLDRYSEIGDKYAEELAALIRFNNLIEFDN